MSIFSFLKNKKPDNEKELAWRLSFISEIIRDLQKGKRVSLYFHKRDEEHQTFLMHLNAKKLIDRLRPIQKKYEFELYELRENSSEKKNAKENYKKIKRIIAGKKIIEYQTSFPQKEAVIADWVSEMIGNEVQRTKNKINVSEEPLILMQQKQNSFEERREPMESPALLKSEQEDLNEENVPVLPPDSKTILRTPSFHLREADEAQLSKEKRALEAMVQELQAYQKREDERESERQKKNLMVEQEVLLENKSDALKSEKWFLDTCWEFCLEELNASKEIKKEEDCLKQIIKGERWLSQLKKRGGSLKELRRSTFFELQRSQSQSALVAPEKNRAQVSLDRVRRREKMLRESQIEHLKLRRDNISKQWIQRRGEERLQKCEVDQSGLSSSVRLHSLQKEPHASQVKLINQFKDLEKQCGLLQIGTLGFKVIPQNVQPLFENYGKQIQVLKENITEVEALKGGTDDLAKLQRLWEESLACIDILLNKNVIAPLFRYCQPEWVVDYQRFHEKWNQTKITVEKFFRAKESQIQWEGEIQRIHHRCLESQTRFTTLVPHSDLVNKDFKLSMKENKGRDYVAVSFQEGLEQETVGRVCSLRKG